MYPEPVNALIKGFCRGRVIQIVLVRIVFNTHFVCVSVCGHATAHVKVRGQTCVNWLSFRHVDPMVGPRSSALAGSAFTPESSLQSCMALLV